MGKKKSSERNVWQIIPWDEKRRRKQGYFKRKLSFSRTRKRAKHNNNNGISARNKSATIDLDLTGRKRERAWQLEALEHCSRKSYKVKTGDIEKNERRNEKPRPALPEQSNKKSSCSSTVTFDNSLHIATHCTTCIRDGFRGIFLSHSDVIRVLLFWTAGECIPFWI